MEVPIAPAHPPRAAARPLCRRDVRGFRVRPPERAVSGRLSPRDHPGRRGMALGERAVRSARPGHRALPVSSNRSELAAHFEKARANTIRICFFVLRLVNSSSRAMFHQILFDLRLGTRVVLLAKLTSRSRLEVEGVRHRAAALRRARHARRGAPRAGLAEPPVRPRQRCELFGGTDLSDTQLLPFSSISDTCVNHSVASKT